MENQIYDGLEWVIMTPIGSSTPDDLVEIEFSCFTTLEDGTEIKGIASFIGTDMEHLEFSHVEYDESEIEDYEDDGWEPDEEDDEDLE